MKDHLGESGFPEHAASYQEPGGTDSYVFQNSQNARDYDLSGGHAVHFRMGSRARAAGATEGFPPLNWYAGEKPGMVTVDGDAFYHSVGDTPANTTDTEPFNMGWCARIGLLSALRLMAGR